VDPPEQRRAHSRWPSPGRGRRRLLSPAGGQPRGAQLHQGPAKKISFGFSTPVENAEGSVLSELPYLKKGLPFLAPEGEITCRWGSLASLIRLFKEKELNEGIRVKTRYEDLAGESYESEWTLNPLLFAGAPMEATRGMNDLVRAVEKIPKGVERDGPE
jgi:hypothetical protein